MTVLDAGVMRPLAQKFERLGVKPVKALAPLWRDAKVVTIEGGKDLTAAMRTNRIAVLLSGISGLYRSTDGGKRQISAFHFPGDFCDLHRVAAAGDELNIAAFTPSSFGLLDSMLLQELLHQSPEIGRVVWLAAALDACISREWVANSGRPRAIERVAHLLSEFLARQEAAGIDRFTIPLTQLDLADAVGLSAIHLNRTLQELRAIGALSSSTHAIEVADKNVLARIGGFDGSYLNIADAMSNWSLIYE